MKKIDILVAIFCLALPLSVNARGNAEEGAKKSETCKTCHGEAGAKPIQPDYPVLAGQHYDYIVAVLTQYKAGKRKNAMMNGFAAALKSEDIQDLAAYFSSQPSELRSKY
jgi:cytochrome c553